MFIQEVQLLTCVFNAVNWLVLRGSVGWTAAPRRALRRRQDCRRPGRATTQETNPAARSGAGKPATALRGVGSRRIARFESLSVGWGAAVAAVTMMCWSMSFGKFATFLRRVAHDQG
eukprot:SAG22_NODE_9857_length_565_cov_21.098712_1_plen_117_part_00